VPNKNKRFDVSWTEVHDLFVEISDYFGYTAKDYEDELTSLISIWNTQEHVEVYQEKRDFQYGKVKDSSKAIGAVPHYLGLFHVRLLQQENDPLVVVVFDDRVEEDGRQVKIASLRFMIHHDDIFGERGTGKKKDSEFMRSLRKRVDSFIQKGNSTSL
jgi:hypothetical protein